MRSLRVLREGLLARKKNQRSFRPIFPQTTRYPNYIVRRICEEFRSLTRLVPHIHAHVLAGREAEARTSGSLCPGNSEPSREKSSRGDPPSPRCPAGGVRFDSKHRNAISCHRQFNDSGPLPLPAALAAHSTQNLPALIRTKIFQPHSRSGPGIPCEPLIPYDCSWLSARFLRWISGIPKPHKKYGSRFAPRTP